MTGVQTCALPISGSGRGNRRIRHRGGAQNGKKELCQKNDGDDRRDGEGPFFPFGGDPFAEVDHHDNENEKNHDRAGIDDDLNHSHKRGSEYPEQASKTGKGQDQEKGAVGLVLGDDHGQDGTHTNNG